MISVELTFKNTKNVFKKLLGKLYQMNVIIFCLDLIMKICNFIEIF
jgi:adenylate cyclase class IV